METEVERRGGDAARGSAWPRAGRSEAAVGERNSVKEMSCADWVERVMSERKEPVDEGASTERGRTAGESFLEDCFADDEMVPLVFIVVLLVVGNSRRRPFELIPN